MTFFSPIEVGIIPSKHFRPGPTGEFVSNRGSLHEILKARPECMACQVTYKKVIPANVGLQGLVLHGAEYDGIWHLKDHDGTTYVVYREIHAAEPHGAIHPNATKYDTSEEAPSDWGLKDLVKLVCEKRDEAFAPEHIKDFHEDLTNGVYWLWTRRGTYHILESGEQPTHMMIWATRPEKSLPNGFEVHFRVMYHDILIGWADQTIVVVAGSKLQQVEEISNLKDFLEIWR